ncbi:YpdA family putative bacillithiol disulfide reductase [Halalkalibacillus halophilus]|uniref:YpdA family putative bacillithiol disulfide reductase n=1 Tax=Halalkalibacillus halophilus TaxID=392827 RepID=UPI00040FCE49|nr:YpdA family putative bacillithiol disulfide reductase [Halalkalibacillus halophilus]
MIKEEVIIIGAGPCGLSTAIELQRKGFEPLILEKNNVANSIFHYPTHQTFFSSSEKLEVGDFPFISERQKPQRNEALTYYRMVAERSKVRIQSYETVTNVSEVNGEYLVHSETDKGKENIYSAKYVVFATGYYGQPNELDVEGENLPHVSHYFKEAHPFFNQDVVIVGGKNSAVDAAIELEKAGANVTVLYRGSEYSKSVKPWILPVFDSLVKNGKISMLFDVSIEKITTENVFYDQNGVKADIHADFVFAMIGYHPNKTFLMDLGVTIDEESGRPYVNPDTMETNTNNIYISGVIAAGYNNNEIFIENGRYHGKLIADSIANKQEAGEVNG